MATGGEHYEDYVRSILKAHIKPPYDIYIDEFVNALKGIEDRLNNSDAEVRNRYRYNLSLLMSKSSKPNIIRAKVNAYYAYLVYRGYVTAYSILKGKLVAGGESLYTWIRMYRSLGI